MRILLVYATNSGGTAAAAAIIEEALAQNGHTVTVKQASEAQPSEIAAVDATVLGSPAWDYNNLEGQPHEDMVSFVARCKDMTFVGKPMAVFGLGDSSYRYFCGAVTYLEAFVKRTKATLVVASLKVDGFYFHADNPEKVRAWATELSGKLKV